MANDYTLKKSAGGVLLKNAAAVLIKSCVPGCEYCTSATPETYTAVFSDVIVCPCSNFKVGETIYLRAWTVLPSVVPNGTHILTQDGSDPCLWTLTEECTGTIGYWAAGSGCIGAPAGTASVTSLITNFSIDASGYALDMSYDGPDAAPLTGPYPAFSGTLDPAGDTDCADEIGPISSDLICGGTFANPRLYYQGAGTVSK